MRFVWKNLPLAMHKLAPAAHMAALAANDQGRFWEFHDRIFADQHNLEPEAYRKYAEELGLDMAEFEEDLIDEDNRKAIDRDKAEAAALGVNSTPGFFVNGRYLSGAQPFQEFAKIINAELDKKGVPVPPEADVE